MKSHMSLGVLAILALGLLPIARLPAREIKWSINVNVTLTEEGKKIDRPRPDHPAYYQAITMGYREEGRLHAGERPPAVDKVVGLLSTALAREGYVESVSGKTPSPSLLLCYHWGTANPHVESVEFIINPDDPQKGPTTQQLDLFKNKDIMLALVSGERGKLPGDIAVQDEHAQQEATEGRYFLIVTAYDYHTAVTEKKKKLLWIARFSAPSQGVTSLEAGLPSLIATAAPFFGREAMPPQRLSVPVVREGKVEVGTPTVRPDEPVQEEGR